MFYALKKISRQNLCILGHLKSLGLALVLFLPLALPAQVFEDQDFRNKAQQGIDQVYNLSHKKAEMIFRDLKHAYPDHPAPHFLLALNGWWQSYICYDDFYHPYIFAELDTADQLNEKLASQPAYALEYTFFQFMIHAFQARLHVRRQSFWPAVRAGRKALPFLKDGFEYAEQAPEFYFSSGIYHYYAETYVEDHPIVKPFMIFFPNGDASRGLAELEKAASTPNFARSEAAFYLSDIYLEKEKAFERALEIKEDLHHRYPQNTWFAVDLARALLAKEQHREAQALLNTLTGQFEEVWKPGQAVVNARQSPFTSLVMFRAYYFAAVAARDLNQSASNILTFLERGRTQANLCGIEKDPLLAEYWFLQARVEYEAGSRQLALQSLDKVLKNDPGDGLKARARDLRKEWK